MGNKEARLINKVKRLIKRLGMPRGLNRFGPKKYELYHHLSALLVRSFCKLSYERTVKLLRMLEIICPSKSALHDRMSKLPSWLWNKAIKITSGIKHYLIALDGTGFSRTNPSYHYLRRINGALPRIPVKLSAAFDTKTKKWCAAKIRVLPAHDIKDAEYLIRISNPKKVAADKAYDSGNLHRYCHENKIEAHIPLRDYGKVRHGNMSYRIKASKWFRARTYHRRELIESGFHSIKIKYGASVTSKKAKTIRAEVLGRLLCHNLFFGFI